VDRLRSLVMRLLSYRTKSWALSDYPLRFREFPADSTPEPGQNQPVRCLVQIVDWYQMAGHGDSRSEAVANLRDNLELYRTTHDGLPRPGTKVPLEFAPSNTVCLHERIARDFMDRVLGLDYDACFISDESSLHDFSSLSSLPELQRKTAEVYGVDVSDVDGAKLGLIFERLAAARPRG